MYRAMFPRFKGIINMSRIALLCAVCFGLSACVEGIDLPEFFTSMQEAGAASSVAKRKPKPQYERMTNGINSKVLLEAKGNWNIVEQGGPMDPTQAHKLAREKVNTRRRGSKKELSAHFQPNAKSGEDGKMRVLRVQRDGHKYRKDTSKYDLAQSSVSKPSHTVAEGDLLKRIKALFGEEDDGGKSLSEASVSASGIVMPGRKPSRGSPIKVASKEDYMHTLDGVVVPPALPARKIVRTSTIVWNLEKAGAVDGTVRPRVKPMQRAAYPRRINPVNAPNRVKAVKLRSGKHKGKTRLVIEVSKPTGHKVVIDHVRGVLRVKLANTRWTMAPQERFTKSTLLGTYIAREQADGSTILEVRLKKQSKILDTVLLRPNLSSQHRIVIDLKD